MNSKKTEAPEGLEKAAQNARSLSCALTVKNRIS